MKMPICFLCAVALILAAGSGFAVSSKLKERESEASPYFDYPCSKFGIPKQLAMAVARQESSMHPWIINIQGKDIIAPTPEAALKLAEEAESRKVSYDVGIMQINSYWIRKYKIPLPMLFRPKDNVYMGCWILKQEINRHGLTWKAVGRYHSPTDWRAAHYAWLVKRHLNNILNDQ